MVRAAALSLVLAATVSVPAIAAEGEVMAPTMLDGNGLYGECQAAAGSFHEGLCAGYVLGAMDAVDGVAASLKGKRLACPPSNATPLQLTDIVRKYLRENPANRAFSASSIVIEALGQAFPCGKPES